MGRLKRRILDEYPIHWQAVGEPPISAEEEGLVEIVDADAMPEKTTEQLATDAATVLAQTKQQATLALIGSVVGQPLNMLQKSFAATVVGYLDGIAKGNIAGVTVEEFTASISLQINAFGSIQQGGK